MAKKTANKANALAVCLNDFGGNEALIAHAEVYRKGTGEPFIALVIDRDGVTRSLSQQQTLEKAMALAEQAGAKVVRLSSVTEASGIQIAAELYKVSHLIIGRMPISRIAGFFKRDTYTKLDNKEGGFSVTAFPIEQEVTALTSRKHAKIQWGGYLLSIVTVLTVTLIVDLIQEILPEYRFNASIYNVSMLYLLAIVFCSIRFGIWPALLASLVSFGLYNYLFIPPFYELTLTRVSDIINLGLFASSSMAALIITQYFLRRTKSLVNQEQTARSLYYLSKDIAGSSDQKQVIESTGSYLSQILEADVYLFLKTDETSEPLKQVFPTHETVDSDVSAVATECLTNKAMIQRENSLFLPLHTARDVIGVLCIQGEAPESIEFIQALSYQAALAFERVQLITEAEEAKIQHARESIRSALLSSVSHDLKTPLVSIIGSLSSIQHMDDSLSSEDRRELLQTAMEEAERLNQSISNILQMTKLESGSVSLNLEWVTPETLFTEVIEKLRTPLKSHHASIIKTAPTLMIKVDANLMHRLLQNLLENAAKYTPNGTHILLGASLHNDGTATIFVEDHGAGIIESEQQRIFDKFARLEKTDSKNTGTGLGLAICKAIAEAHGGTINLVTPKEHHSGCRFVITLPTAKPLDEENAA